MSYGRVCGFVALVVFGVFAGPALAQQTYVVQRGDTLSFIAERFLGHPDQWRCLCRKNQGRILACGTIIPGTRLEIPVREECGVAIPPPPPPPPATDSVYIVTGNGFLPFSDEKMPNGGMATEIVQRAFAHGGVNVKVDFLDWILAETRSIERRYIAIFPYAKTEEREVNFIFSRPFYEAVAQMYTQASNRNSLAVIEDLAGLRVCRPEADFTDFMDHVVGSLRDFQRPKTIEECFVRLIEGRVDVVVGGEFDSNFAIGQLGAEQMVRIVGDPVYVGGLYVMFPRLARSSIAMRARFNKGLSVLESSGEIDAIAAESLEWYYENLKQ